MSLDKYLVIMMYVSQCEYVICQECGVSGCIIIHVICLVNVERDLGECLRAECAWWTKTTLLSGRVTLHLVMGQPLIQTYVIMDVVNVSVQQQQQQQHQH